MTKDFCLRLQNDPSPHLQMLQWFIGDSPPFVLPVAGGQKKFWPSLGCYSQGAWTQTLLKSHWNSSEQSITPPQHFCTSLLVSVFCWLVPSIASKLEPFSSLPPSSSVPNTLHAQRADKDTRPSSSTDRAWL